MKNMDYRLDLFNAVTKYSEEMSEDDCLLIIANNVKDRDALCCSIGNINILSNMMTSDGYVNFPNEESEKAFANTQNQILNIAINILRTNEDKLVKFKIALDAVIFETINKKEPI